MLLPRARARYTLALCVTLALLAWFPLPAPRALAATEVQVDEPADEQAWAFDPGEIHVQTGEPVTWRNTGQELHTVTADDDGFDSGLMDSGQFFQHSFASPGTYTYACRVHPWMHGVVVVEQAPPRLLFPQTGFAVDDPALADYFRSRGGARTFGYPISRLFTLRGARVQVFQRFVLERAEDGSARTYALLDPAVFPYIRFDGMTVPGPDPAVVAAAPAPTLPDYADRAVAFARAHVPQSFEGQTIGFADAYFGAVTCADAFPDGGCQPEQLPMKAVELWGLPTSDPAHDPAHPGAVAQRFQHGILRYDPSTGRTQALPLGELFRALLMGVGLPPDLALQVQGSPYFDQYDPEQPRWLARPDALPLTDLTNAFTPQAR